MTAANLTASVAALAVLALAAGGAAAQTAPGTDSQGALRPGETPWPIVLGQRAAALERKIGYELTSTDQPYDEALASYLARRHRRG